MLLATAWLSIGAAADDGCRTDPIDGRILCDISGTIPGEDEPIAEPIKAPKYAPPPLRYLRVTSGGCYVWSPSPPGIDAWDPINEDLIYANVIGTPECTSEPLPDRAWRVFHSFPLAKPSPTFQPGEHGITGLPTYLASPNPTTITHSEVLPSGDLFEVRAMVATLTVDWGDGSITRDTPSVALPWPDGSMTHTYTTKTCPPEYRITHPSGQNCHPTLEAYPITATYTWWGEYRVGGVWIPIGTLDLAITVAYDVDEVIGVLVDP